MTPTLPCPALPTHPTQLHIATQSGNEMNAHVCISFHQTLKQSAQSFASRNHNDDDDGKNSLPEETYLTHLSPSCYTLLQCVYEMLLETQLISARAYVAPDASRALMNGKTRELGL